MAGTGLVLAIMAVTAVVAMAAPKPGCSNCHVDKYSLANEVKNVQGHMPVAATAGLADCMKCHKSGKLAFGPILHKMHFKTGTNHFTVKPENGCQSCHLVNPADGSTSVQP
jgi:nitrate/TMAO reductase-like tetraheme cytochrome c subunit